MPRAYPTGRPQQPVERRSIEIVVFDGMTLRQLRRAFIRDYLYLLMSKHGGDVNCAAREAGVARTGLYRYLKVCGVSWTRRKPGPRAGRRTAPPRASG